MAGHGNQDRTIQAEARECRGLLADTMVHLSQHDPLSIGVALQDELGRFNLWAGNIGVFAPLQISLDFRLIDVPEIKGQFLRQLDTLSISLIQLKDAARDTTDEHETQQEDGAGTSVTADDSLASDHDIVELVQSIHVTIDWLHRLSNLVRKASFASQNQRAAKFPLTGVGGNDLTECLSGIFEYLIKRECNDIADQILDRLVQTMITRRRRVLYRRSRQKRWTLEREAYRPRHLDPPAQLTPVQEGEEAEEEVQDGSEEVETTEFKAEHQAQIPPSRLTVTTIDQQKYKKLAAPSRISRATTAPFQHNEKLMVPPRPHLAKQGKEFVCDYCCLILPSDEAHDRDKWAAHVKKDLDPYICVFDDCNQPYQIYSSSKEWLAHMRSEHRMSWRCVVRDHPPQTFETRAAFIQHMTDVHPGKFPEQQLHFIAESSARALSPTIPACPFCAEVSGDLEGHVAQHLCHFALQSLPWPDDLEQGSQEGSSWGHSRSSSEGGERDTLKDQLDDDLNSVGDYSLNSIAQDLEPLETPVSWPEMERGFPEVDNVLNEFAAQAAKRAAMPPGDDLGASETLEQEIARVKVENPDIEWRKFDTDARVLDASLQFVGTSGQRGNINVRVRISFPRGYPETQKPMFSIEPAAEAAGLVMREMLERQVQQVAEQCLQQQQPCLSAAFARLKAALYFSPGDSVSGNAPVTTTPEPIPGGFEFEDAAGKHAQADIQRPHKAGYLAKRGNSGGWKARYYVLQGPQLNYYEGVGGPHLGSIKLQGAQIGRQTSHDDASSADDNRVRHALLILEPSDGSTMLKHVLCAESDEDRDLWIEALLPRTEYTGPSEDEKGKEQDGPGGAKPRRTSPVFLIQKNDKSGQFLGLENVMPSASIASASIGRSQIDCRLLLSKTRFGTLDGMPAGIMYMDISIATPQDILQTVTVTVTLEEAPQIEQLFPSAPGSGSGSSGGELMLTDHYGPKSLVGRRHVTLRPEVNRLGFGLGGIGAETSTRAWTFSGQLFPGKGSGSSVYRSLRWNFSHNSSAAALHESIHTGFVFQGAGQAFLLKADIEGRLSKLSDRIRRTSFGRASRSSSRRGQLIVNWGSVEKHNNYRLDELARALPRAMESENEETLFLTPSERPLESFDVLPRAHDFDAPHIAIDKPLYDPNVSVDQSAGPAGGHRDSWNRSHGDNRDRAEALDEGTSKEGSRGRNDGELPEGTFGEVVTYSGSKFGAGTRRGPLHDIQEEDAETEDSPGIRFDDTVKRSDEIEDNERSFPTMRRVVDHIAILQRQRRNEDEVLRIPGPKDVERGARPTRLENIKEMPETIPERPLSWAPGDFHHIDDGPSVQRPRRVAEEGSPASYWRDDDSQNYEPSVDAHPAQPSSGESFLPTLRRKDTLPYELTAEELRKQQAPKRNGSDNFARAMQNLFRRRREATRAREKEP